MYKRKDCIYKKNELKKLYYLYIIDIKLNQQGIYNYIKCFEIFNIKKKLYKVKMRCLNMI